MVVSRPAAVRDILVANAAAYVRPNAAVRVLSAPIGGGLFLAEGAEWRRQRRLFAPSFAPREAGGFMGHVATLAERLVRRLAAAAPGVVDLFAAVQSLTLAVAAQSLLSIDIAPWDGPLRAMVVSYSHDLARPGLLDFLLPPGVPSLRDLRRHRFRRRWMTLVRTIVAHRLRDAVQAADLFDTLVRSGPDRALLHEHVATLLVTGSETTGAALYWSLYLLAARPDLQDRVADEAGADLGTLPLARAVVQEAMRLYPPAFSIVRQALEATDAAGVAIPKGAIVQTAPFVLHRHAQFWQRPQVFDPDRFLPGAPPPDRSVYIPFGLGPRACIAAQFAQAEAVLVLAMLVRAFRITPTTDRPVWPTAQITLQPYDPAPFRIAARVPH